MGGRVQRNAETVRPTPWASLFPQQPAAPTQPEPQVETPLPPPVTPPTPQPHPRTSPQAIVDMSRQADFRQLLQNFFAQRNG